jgi:hypothetical protein
VARPGSCFKVQIPGRSGIERGQQTHFVPPGTTLVYTDRTQTDIAPPAGALKVREGDIVCVTGATPPPEVALTRPSEPSPTLAVVVVSVTGSTRLTTGEPDRRLDLFPELYPVVRNLGYLPYGALYLLAAPFPWQIAPVPAWWPLVPEMILWYVTVAFAFVGLWRWIARRQWDLIYVVLVGLAVGGLLSLIEGNLGTLIRHRDMIIPSAIVVASPVIAEAVLPRLRRYARSRRE